MLHPSRKAALYVSTGCAVALAWSAPLLAQPLGADPDSTYAQEVIVTARKRQESLLNVPVVETVIEQGRLERLQTTDIGDLPKLVPGLNIGRSMLAIGTQVSIRGVGTSSQDPGVDQSVSLNIDGLSLGQGLAFSSGLFDLSQIEVLKGPQALFYGKASPGGVIALRTADPGSELELIARAGYEFEARERRGELIVSGPVTDNLRARLAAMYSKADGYFENNAIAAPGTGALTPTHSREPQPESYIIRGTVLWRPSDQFNARFKINRVYDHAINAEQAQLVSCPDGPGQAPTGIPFIGGDNCRMDRDVHVVYMDPASFPGISNNGVPFLENNQTFGTLELNYRPTDTLTLTSTTAMYQLKSKSLVNTSHTTAAGPLFAFENRFKRREFTQELRLDSDFSEPVNFTLGYFYQDGRLTDHVTAIGNAAYGFPRLVTDGATAIDIKASSVFGQLRWQVTPRLELAGGARYTDEKRSETPESFITGQVVRIPVRTPEIHSSNLAPEATVTFKPTEDLTLFAAYKVAYKSGSFTVATLPLPGGDNSFGDEKVRGGEIGLKSRLLDRRLMLNLAAYDYRYNGLQVGAIEPVLSTGLPVIRTVNAGSARTYGIDLESSYRPPQIDGLGFNLAVNWNHARYRTLNNIPCYGGQTIAQGCTEFLNPVTGLFTAQDLSGTPLIRAPEWQATFGFDYERPVGHGMTLAFTNSNQYSSRYVAFFGLGRPNGDNYRQSYIKTDLSLALRGEEERWEVALIGKNITDRLTSGLCSATNFAAGLSAGTQITGGPSSGLAGASEAACNTDRGREIWVRFTYRPFAGR